MTFSAWHPLSPEGLLSAPDGPAAIQLRRATGLVDYPTGKSAMVFYVYAERSAREALRRLFLDELAEPGARGEGPLLFRFEEGEGARAALERLFDEFVARFGAPPCLHAEQGDAP